MGRRVRVPGPGSGLAKFRLARASFTIMQLTPALLSTEAKLPRSFAYDPQGPKIFHLKKHKTEADFQIYQQQETG